MNGCKHEVKLNTLCAICGEDTVNLEKTDSTGLFYATDELKITQDKIDDTIQMNIDRLNGEKKLNCVLDLDQTVLHSIYESCIDPSIIFEIKNGIPKTIGVEGEEDNLQILHEESKKIKIEEKKYIRFVKEGIVYYRFKIENEPMVTEIRPHFAEMIHSLKDMYVFHIYTNGNREYAVIIAEILQNEYEVTYGKEDQIFEKRVISRDENNMSFNKSLRRIGLSNKNTVIVDDRYDIWEYNDSLLLIKEYKEGDVHEFSKDKLIKTSKGEEKDKELLSILKILKDLYDEYFYENKNNSLKNILTSEDLKEMQNEFDEFSSTESEKSENDINFDNLISQPSKIESDLSIILFKKKQIFSSTSFNIESTYHQLIMAYGGTLTKDDADIGIELEGKNILVLEYVFESIFKLEKLPIEKFIKLKN